MRKTDDLPISSVAVELATRIRLRMDRLTEDRDALLVVAKHIYAELDNIYDVDQRSDGSHRESPFSGAGELMTSLRIVIERAEKP